MKKVISWILTIALLFSLMPAGTFTLTAEAATVASGKCGTNLTWTLDSTGTLTISGTGRMIDYPYEDTWYDYLERVKSVVIGDNVTNIGVYAFIDCVNLTSVTIGKKVSSIDAGAFSYCSSLKSISIPSNVTSIGEGAFIFCESLKEFKVDSANASFVAENGVLFNKSKTELVSYPAGKEGAYTIPASVTSIAEDAFRSCTKLTSVEIPEGVKNIGDGAFSGCTSLTQVEIPNYVTNIGWYAFEFCTSLTKVTFGECVDSNGATTGIGRQAFNYTNLKEIYFEGRSPVINEYAFPDVIATAYYYPDETWTEDVRQNYGGTITWVARERVSEGLEFTLSSDGTYYSVTGIGTCTDTDIVIPDTHQGKPVKAVGSNAFKENANITSVTIPDGVTSIGDYAFYYCTGLTGELIIPDGVTSIGHSAFSVCTGLTSVTIPDSVTQIGWYAFSSCSGMNTVTIPGRVTDIGNYAFVSCTGLTSVTLSDGVTNIGWYAFQGCTNLTSVTMGNSIKTIGIKAFADCNSLTSITIPDCVIRIDKSAFQGCTSLTSIFIPNSVENIGKQAFTYCTSLTGVWVSGDNTNYSSDESGVLFNKNKTELVQTPGGISGSYAIPNSVTSIGDYAFEYTKLTSVTIPGSVTSIGDSAFWKCTSLKEIYFDGSAPAIGSDAFRNVIATAYYYPDESWTEDVRQDYGGDITWVAREPEPEIIASGTCGPNLTWTLDAEGTLTISGTGAMADYAANTIPWYSYRESIKTVIIGSGVTNIGNYAFYNCLGLPGVLIIPDSVTSIGNSAFEFCKGLSGELVIPDSVTSIGYQAFSSCTGLTSVTLGNSVETIGFNAFRRCTGLAGELIIPNSVTSIGYCAFDECTGLTALTIGNSMETIGSAAFRGCSGLTSVTIPDSVTNIDYNAFSRCSSLQEICFEGSAPAIGSNAFSSIIATAYYYPDETWTEDVMQDYGGNITWVARQSASEGLEFTLSADSTYYSVTGIGTCKDTDIVIPDTHQGKPVKAIGNKAFQKNTNITSVKIPDSVTTIGNQAFQGCTGITAVTIGNSVETIGANAFSDCKSLVGDLTIPDSVTSIGSCAFYHCAGLTNVTIGNSVTTIGESAFDYCTGLTGELIIPDSVTSIGRQAFNHCSGLSSVTIGNGVQTLGNSVFDNCTGLTGELIIPNSVTSIGDQAFYYCSGLSSVTIGNGVKTIGSYAFCYCTGLTGELMIPDSITSIGYRAFEYCTGLSSVTIGNGVKTIYDYAFWACSGLTGELMIPDSVTSIGDSAFGYCSGLSSVTIGNGVKTIGGYAFYYCAGVKEVYFEGSAPTIGKSAFSGVTATAYYYPDETWTEDVRQNYGGNITWVARERVSEGLEFTLSSDGTYYSVTGIGTCTDTDIVIPDTHDGKPVKAIGNDAFKNNANITSVNIPDSVTSIGFYAFYKCTRLTSVSIGNGVENIKNNAFDWCTKLTQATIGRSVETIGDCAFQYCGLVGELTLPDSVTSIGKFAFQMCTGLTSVNIPNSVTSIGGSAFSGCTRLTSVTIPDSVTSIGNGAFAKCDGLTGIWVNAGNAKYSSDEFGVLFDKDKITLIQMPGGISDGYIIPNSVTSIDNFAFSGCTRLSSVTIGSSVEAIGRYAFSGCTRLTNMTIPDSVISIDDFAFQGCTGLDSVTIGNRVETIGGYAFNRCTDLKEIYFEGSAPAIGSNAFGNVTATAYYYPDESWTEDVRQNYGGTITWVALSKCEHDFTDWMPIELDGVTYRIRVCKKCGYIETDLPENVVHLHDWQWESKDPTCTEPGYKDYIWCKNCDLAVSKILIDPLGHDESGDWVQGTDKHWKICQRPECGDKILEADHSHGQWVEDTPAKCETAGTKHRTCECGHIEYGTDPKLGHDDSDAWHYDANGHWKICQRPECGETILLENHQHNMLVGSVPATCTEQGYNIYSCKCEHTENRDFNGPLEHIPGSWQFNGTHHWKTCQRSGCGEQLNKAAHNLKIEKVEVTCTKDGYTTYSCDCGYFEKRDVVTALDHDDSGEWYYNDDQHWKICDRDNCDEKILKAGHSYGNWVVDTEAKCETAGSKHRTCTTCGYIQREEITKLDHIQSGVWHYDANGHWKICQRPGCGEKILAADHSLQKGKVTDPTCTEQGYTTYHCVCGYSVKKDFTDAKIHDESGEWLYNDTQHWKICQRPECGKTILLANHQHNTLVDSVSATCTEQGYSIYACQCEHTENRDFNGPLEHIPGSWQYNRTHHWKTCQRENCGAELEKAEHTLKTKKVEVTCTTDGYTTDYCDCGHANTHDVVTAPGHDESGDWVQGTDKHWKICQRENCGAKILETVHSYGNWVVDTEAKCETAGSKHRTCTTCGYIQREEITKLDHIQSGVWHYDANGHWKICQRPGCGEKILAADHSLQKGKVTDPTCTEQGYTTYHCVCGYSVKKDFTDAKIHDDSGKWLYNDTQHWKICQRPECGKTILLANHKFTTVKVDATCTEQGYTTYSCNCGYTDKRDEVTIPGHDYNGAWYYDANGHWKICQRSGCNEKLLTADHSYGDWVVDTVAKCATAGSKHRTCTTCDYVQREVIPAPGHDDSGSWQHNDSKHWKVCGECGENIQTSNHSYGNWITDVAAECEKDGSKHRNCMCGYTEYGVIPAKGHDHSGPWQKDESGHWKICGRDNCDKILDKSGHNYGEYILKTDKSTQNGITVFTHCVVSECGKCGYEWSSDSTDVHIHERVTVIHSVEPTCTEPGSTVGLICAECGEVLIATTVVPALGHHFVDGVCDRCGMVYMIGDVNGDGMVNSLDGLILMRYLNGWNVKVAVPEAMDVNCDGKVNSLDGLILIRYLNGWNVTLG